MFLKRNFFSKHTCVLLISWFRGYTYIDDAIDCIMLILQNKDGVCNKETFNIGAPENETTIRDLAHKVYIYIYIYISFCISLLVYIHAYIKVIIC